LKASTASESAIGVASGSMVASGLTLSTSAKVLPGLRTRKLSATKAAGSGK
jgi:hypothetical protein